MNSNVELNYHERTGDAQRQDSPECEGFLSINQRKLLEKNSILLIATGRFFGRHS